MESASKGRPLGATQSWSGGLYCPQPRGVRLIGEEEEEHQRHLASPTPDTTEEDLLEEVEVMIGRCSRRAAAAGD